MTPERYQRVKEIFAEACQLAGAARAAFLDRACTGDAELRAELEALLACDDESLVLEPKVAAADVLDLRRVNAPAEMGTAAGMASRKEVLPEKIGPYGIVREIGRGGMGVVYEATQENPRRTIALKVIRPGVASDQLLRRFQLEAHVLGQLQHPGIAQIYEAGIATITALSGLSSEQPYFAMEYVHGRPLTDLIADPGLDVRERLTLFAKICDAVQHAHQKGVIHRDLKPGNVLVDESGQPRILDFGVARLADSDVQPMTMQTAAGQVIGTIPYMSPEQISGRSQDLDTRSDVYALGVICYELLTARLPYDLEGKTIPEAARAVTSEELTRLSAIDRTFRGDLETIVAKALEKDRERRYQAASDLAADVRCYLSDRPIAARPSTTVYQLRKFARRNKALVCGVLVAFTALAIGVVGTTSQAIRATRQRDRALRAEQLADERRETAESRAYAANIAAAHAAVNANDVGTARQRLELAPRHLRDFEWEYLSARLDDSLLSLEEHADWVWTVDLDPRGTHLASSSKDGTIRIWDLATGQSCRTLRSGGAEFWGVSYSPDGARLAGGAHDGRVLLWNMETEQPPRLLLGHQGALNTVRFSSDGALIASASLDRSARIWDARTGEQRNVLTHPHWVYCVSFSPDGARLATTCRDNLVRIWDLTSSTPEVETVLAPQPGCRDFIHSWPVAFSPDGATLASGSHSGLVKVWDAKTGTLWRTLVGHTDRVRAVSYSPDCQRLASASADGTVRTWDIDDGVELATLRGHRDAVFSVAFSPDGSRLASGSRDGTVKLWDSRITSQLATLWGHENRAIRTLAIAPDGRRIATGGEDHAVRLWDAVSGAGLVTMRGHSALVARVAFSPDGALVASGGWDNLIKLWDACTGNEIATLAGHEWYVSDVAFSPDGVRLASACRDGTLAVWDVASRSRTLTIAGHGEPMGAVAFNPAGTVIASGSEDGTVGLWSAGDGRRLSQAALHGRSVTCVAFSPDGHHLVSASGDHTLKLWDARDLTGNMTLRAHTDVVSSLAFSPNGKRIASVSWDGTLRIWDVATGEPLLSLLAHQDYAFAVAFSPDGTWLASTSKYIRLWETTRPDLVVLGQRRVRIAAEDLVERLSTGVSTSAEVIARIELEPDISDDVRQGAVQIAGFRLP